MHTSAHTCTHKHAHTILHTQTCTLTRNDAHTLRQVHGGADLDFMIFKAKDGLDADINTMLSEIQNNRSPLFVCVRTHICQHPHAHTRIYSHARVSAFGSVCTHEGTWKNTRTRVRARTHTYTLSQERTRAHVRISKLRACLLTSGLPLHMHPQILICTHAPLICTHAHARPLTTHACNEGKRMRSNLKTT